MTIRELLEQGNIFALLRQVNCRSKYSIEDFHKGVHYSSMKGVSAEFSEYKQYVHGDDLRKLDWRVYARSDKYYMKKFHEEVTQTCYFLLDCSNSMNYGTTGLTKSTTARLLAASIAYIFLNQHDAVGLSLFSDHLISQIHPSNNPAQFATILQTLDEVEAEGTTDIGTAISQLADSIVKRGLIVVLSDFVYQMPDPARLIENIGMLNPKKNAVVVLHLLDPLERTLDINGRYEFQCLESTLKMTVRVNDVKQHYRALIEGFIAKLSSGCAAQGVAYRLIETELPVETLLFERILSAMSANSL